MMRAWARGMERHGVSSTYLFSPRVVVRGTHCRNLAMGCGGSKKSAATVGVVPDGDVAAMTSPNEAKAKELAARQNE